MDTAVILGLRVALDGLKHFSLESLGSSSHATTFGSVKIALPIAFLMILQFSVF